MKKILPIISILFLFPFSTEAKDPDLGRSQFYSPLVYRNQIEFHIDIFSPTGAFAKILDGATPTGFGFNYIRKMNPRWSVGAEAGVAMYYNAEYDLQTSIGSVPVYEEDCFWQVRGIARYSLIETEAFKSYGEFRLGFNNFFSDVSATVDVVEDVGKTVSHGVSLVAGVGLGVELGLGTLSDGSPILDKTFLSLRTVYNFGSPTYYRSAKVPSGQTNDFEKQRYYSEISYFDVNFGIGWRF
jgi:hypothetical protein